MDVDRLIGRNLSRLLADLDIEPERLASALKISPYALHRVLTGQQRLRPPMLLKAITFLSVPVAAVFAEA